MNKIDIYRILCQLFIDEMDYIILCQLFMNKIDIEL